MIGLKHINGPFSKLGYQILRDPSFGRGAYDKHDLFRGIGVHVCRLEYILRASAQIHRPANK